MTKAKLLDEDGRVVTTIQIEDSTTYRVNDHFHAPDGGLRIVSEVTLGADANAAELPCVWIDGPHPSGVI